MMTRAVLLGLYQKQMTELMARLFTCDPDPGGVPVN